MIYCALVDGGWSSWSDWTQCSATCGVGLQARDRVCNRPAPHYGQRCNGSARQVDQCEEYCPGKLRSTMLHPSITYFHKVDVDSTFAARHTAAVLCLSVCLSVTPMF